MQVSFPLVLDALEFCTEALKAELEGPRAAFREAEDAKAGIGASAKKARLDAAAAAKADGDAEMADAPAAAAPTVASASHHAGALTGRYELAGVLTHKGRSADSGHYVAWVKQEDGQWVQFDDDTMILRKEEEVATLAGGGDWHMAYLCFYRFKGTGGVEEEKKAPAAAANK